MSYAGMMCCILRIGSGDEGGSCWAASAAYGAFHNRLLDRIVLSGVIPSSAMEQVTYTTVLPLNAE